MTNQIFKYHFKINLVLPSGNKMTVQGEVFDVTGQPNSAFDQVRKACADICGPASMYDNSKITLIKNKMPVQRIKLVHEPKGMEGIEKCCFCGAPTVYWSWTDKPVEPVCRECATRHGPEELPGEVKSSLVPDQSPKVSKPQNT
jgi:hypothetical protein